MIETGPDPRSSLSPERPAYVFHHFMKCGGTSITNVLHRWFKVINDHLISFDRMNEYVAGKVDLSLLKPDDCVVGHYAVEGTYLFERYPELLQMKDRIRIFTFLRDPLEFFLSFYFYSRKEGRMQQTLKEFLDFNRNLLAYYFPCDEMNYKDVIDRYSFVGILEDLEFSMMQLAKMTNKPFYEIPKLNSTGRDIQTTMITERFKNRFMAENQLDYAIYEYAKLKLRQPVRS